MDPDQKLKECTAIRSVANSDFEADLGKLLLDTGDHYIVTRNLIRAFARHYPERGLQVAAILNIAPRRNQAILDCIREHIAQPLEAVNCAFLRTALTQLLDRGLTDHAVADILERFDDEEEVGDLWTRCSADLIAIIAAGETIFDPALSCDALAHAVAILERGSASSQSANEGLEKHLLAKLWSAWENMDDSAAKIDAAFGAAVILSETRREEAVDFLAAGRTARYGLGVDYTSPSYLYCVRLAIRSYSGLLPQQIDTEDDFERLTSQIRRIKSQSTKVFLWTDLALRFFKNERDKEGKRVVREYIRPTLNSMARLNEAEWHRAIATAAPALFSAHPDTAIEDIKHLRPLTKDVAAGRVVDFILRKTPLADPFDSEGVKSRYQLAYEAAVDLCKIAGLITSDSLLYKVIEAIGRSGTWKHNENRFSPEQRSDIAEKLRLLVSSKLPAKEFICHEGYIILCEAEIARITREKHTMWEALAERARALPNLSDRVFVLCYLSDAYEHGGKTYRASLLDEASKFAKAIPSRLDRVDRFEVIAGCANELNQKKLMQSLLEEALSSIRDDDEDQEGNPTRRSIVDFAYRLDADFATTLASRMDDDEARTMARKGLKPLEIKKRFLDSKDEKLGELDDVRAVARAAWLSLGSLNANRAETRHVRTTREVVKLASAAPLPRAYPILSWVIENAIRRRAQATEAKRLIRELFEACMLGCELAASSVSRVPDVAHARILNKAIPPSERTVIRPGERTRALDVLRDWLATETDEYLKISDPYFTPADLELLQLVLSVAPKLKVKILTSKKQQLEQKVELPWDDAYQRYWRDHFSEQNPPDTTLYIIGTQKTFELPLHDRWWITKNAKGLRLGISFNGLGEGKSSEVTRLSATEAREREAEIDGLVSGDVNDRLGEKMSISYFTIG